MVGFRRAAFAEESAEVEVLYANLDKMKSLTKKIQSSMGRLETSGRTVEDAIGPVYGNTQKLQITNGNIDRIIAAIDRIREPLDMRNKEEVIIRASPQKVGLAEYMASIDRTRLALRNMKQTNLRSNQQAISELNSLLGAGNQQLEDVFRESLREVQQPVEPLHFITKGVGFPRLQQNKISQLSTINAYVASSVAEMSSGSRTTTPTAIIYADTRGHYLTYSLQNLATATMATARKQHADVMYKRGDNAIGTYTAGMHGIYAAEYENITQIFAREDWGQVLSMTCQSSINAFAITLGDLDKHIKDNLMSDCFLAYEILEVVSNGSVEFERETGATELKNSMADAVKPVRETAKASLSASLSDIRTRAQQMQQLPQDGSTVSLTTDAMSRLQAMTEYLLPVSSILTSLGDGGWSSSPNPNASSASIPTLRSFDVGPDSKMLFSHYGSDTIETLMSNLQMRAHSSLRTKSLQGVFLLNNISVVDRMIRSSELQPLLDTANIKIDAWRKKATALYLDTWKETSAYLLDVQYTNRGVRPPSTGNAIDSAAVLKSLSSKDKDAIKEKFKNFNISFEENVQKHRTYKMEKEVRSHLAKEVQMFIEALYGRFWDRYHDVDKGKGKYVKYDKSQLNTWLANLA